MANEKQFTPYCMYQRRRCLLALKIMMFTALGVGLVFIIAYCAILKNELMFLLAVGIVFVVFALMFMMINVCMCCETGCSFFWKVHGYTIEQVDQAQLMFAMKIAKEDRKEALDNKYLDGHLQMCECQVQQPITTIVVPVVLDASQQQVPQYNALNQHAAQPYIIPVLW